MKQSHTKEREMRYPKRLGLKKGSPVGHNLYKTIITEKSIKKTPGGSKEPLETLWFLSNQNFHRGSHHHIRP